ncbi:hypothetical protein LOTGIDRAFT_169216 [Lottia gigantea]|uniref:C2H2-type domain-containing protein n=1 Tax=Lottia gigantea TaxID=225164 RepID=V3ZH75_LOTGI|nr:hypothetical protein LOTGIDRAFT_169216 [Lottia gigantea]ESO83522.1 hypothetical protein LOTGIDRAFT_169216 [Lottia gigantea]
MADNEDENGLITIPTLPNVSDSLHPESVIVNETGEGRVITDEEAEDILQQAIQDAQEFGEEAVALSYVTADGETDHTNIATQEIVNNGVTNSNDDLVSVQENAGYDVAYAVVSDNGDIIQTADTMSLDDSGMDNIMLASESQSQTQVVTFQQAPSSDNTITLQANEFANSVQQGGLNVTLVPANQNSVAPIGSSQNPIRIVQQGNQYTPVQQLTAEQLQQIMHVVQEQQLAKSADSNNGSSILYNPQTNTRIVYRVIYPSELHKSTSNSSTENTSITIGSQTGVDNTQIQRRAYKKRTREDEEDKVEVPELSKEEKEERKKHRPRTRSGRVSKPPKHMVKDYKHIHVLDWDEDYDDSDGGYSDFKISDEDKRGAKPLVENGENSRDAAETDGLSGVERVKNHKCETCDKAYIGQGGLRRHYQLNPSHGSLPDDIEDVDKASSINSNNNKSNGSICSLSEDSNTQDSLLSQSVTPTSNTVIQPTKRRGPGRPPFNVEGAPGKRRAKLQDLIRQCTDDELMEIVLPRLAKVVTLWEFLMMKLEKGGKATPKVEDIFHEFESIQKQVAKTCQDCLIPMAENKESNEPSAGSKLQIEDSSLAASLGLKIGQYQVKSLPVQEKSFHYKFLTTEPRGIPVPTKRQNNRRTIEIVTPDELIQTNSKKPRMTTILNNNVLSMAAKSATPTVVTATSSLTTSSIPTSGIIKSSSSSSLLTPSLSNSSITPISQNHTIISEPLSTSSLPITSQFVNTASTSNGTSHVRNTQTVILTNSAPTSNSFTSLNGGTILAVNGSGNQVQENYRVQILGNSAVLNSSTVNSTIGASNSVLLTNSSIGNQPVLVNSVSENKSILLNNSVNGNNSVSLLNPTKIPENSVVYVQGNNQTPLENNAVFGNNTILVNSTNTNSLLNGDSIKTADTVNNACEITPKIEMPETAVPNFISPDELTNSTLDVKPDISSEQLDIKHNDMQLQDLNTDQPVQNVAELGVQGEIISEQGQIINAEGEFGSEQILNVGQIEGEILTPDQIVTSGSNIYQTEDGTLIIQQPDGTTFQLQGAEGIPMETVQALLSMESEGQYVEQEQIQTDLQ